MRTRIHRCQGFGLGDASAEFAMTCTRAGLMVQHLRGECVRVTIGEPTTNDYFLNIAAQYRKNLHSAGSPSNS
jgi:histidinol-phosphate aminotransferase